MPRIRIEWVPVQSFGLGLLGFDHLQLVYQQSDADSPSGQDGWFVMEGVREAGGTSAFLGIEGADGRTTLSVANLAARDALIAKIGTPEYRGSRSLPYAGDEFQAWETMASYARDIEGQDFPYIAYGLPGSPTPTVNSSSAIASLIYYSGLDPSLRLPYGVHLSPGTATRLGTSGPDTMRIEYGFTTLLGGHGHDVFIGGSNTTGAEKFYGGRDDDLFHWSAGFNVVHGGQSELDYAVDGTDSMDYSGAGTVTITLNRHWVPHKSPNYVAVLGDGHDHLYSIERIQWNEMTDRIILGDGVHLVEDDVILEPATRGAIGEPPAPASPLRTGRLIDESRDAAPVRTTSDLVLPEDARDLELADPARVGQGNAQANRLTGNGADNILNGMQGADTLYGGIGNDILNGGPGSDGYVYLAGDGNDTIVETNEAGTDVLIMVGIAPHQVSLHRPWQRPDDAVLTLDSGGCLIISDFFKGPFFGIERIIFDAAPAWTREDMSRLAAAASPGVGHATLPCAALRVPASPGDRLEPAAAASLDPGSSLWDAAPGTDTVVPEADYRAGLEAPGGWLF